ncbi:MAG: GNAT family N-acetyltransferase [Candidatus Heimdallarchaeota archaeon]|nr:GNAT family N-acetyltransferase [Candidatus Heimdallarchaeota archaeon]
MMKMETEYVIEQFTLEDKDFGEFAKLITSAFLADGTAQEEGATIVFSENTFRMMFGAPSVDRNLFVKATYKKTKEIVGFLGAIPRELKIVDEKYKFVMPSWLCVHSDHQRKGLATVMGEKLFSICVEANYQGAFSLFEPKQHGKDVSRVVADIKNIIIKRIISTDKFVIRVIDAEKISQVVKVNWYEKLAFKIIQKIPKVENNHLRLHKKSDADRMFNLLMEHVERNQLSIVPKKKDFLWVLRQPGVNCVVYTNSDDEVKGFILAWEFNLAGFGYHYPCGWLDTVHIHGLTNKEAKKLAQFLSYTSKQRGWIAIQTPYIPYFDSKPLRRAKFILYPQTLSLDMMLVKDIDIPEKVDSFYFDWR